MENNFLLTDDLLWDYADGFLEAPEKIRVERYLQQHSEWSLRLQTILKEKKALAALPLETPHPGFAEQVMATLATQQASIPAKASPNWPIRLITFVFVVFVLTPIAVLMITAPTIAPGASLLPEFQIPQLPVIDWADWLNSPALLYGLLLLTATLGLRFLDKILQHQRLAQKLA